MSREHIYKAKRVNWRELPKWEWWVEGCLLVDYVSGQYFIHANGNSVNESVKVNEEGCLKFFAYEVEPETVCEYTQMTDINKNKIWENDIVAYMDAYSTDNGYAESDCVGKVLWCEEELCFYVTERLSAESWEVLEDCYVIGNIFDNPELLEGGEAE